MGDLLAAGRQKLNDATTSARNALGLGDSEAEQREAGKRPGSGGCSSWYTHDLDNCRRNAPFSSPGYLDVGGDVCLVVCLAGGVRVGVGGTLHPYAGGGIGLGAEDGFGMSGGVRGNSGEIESGWAPGVGCSVGHTQLGLEGDCSMSYSALQFPYVSSGECSLEATYTW